MDKIKAAFNRGKNSQQAPSGHGTPVNNAARRPNNNDGPVAGRPRTPSFTESSRRSRHEISPKQQQRQPEQQKPLPPQPQPQPRPQQQYRSGESEGRRSAVVTTKRSVVSMRDRPNTVVGTPRRTPSTDGRQGSVATKSPAEPKQQQPPPPIPIRVPFLIFFVRFFTFAPLELVIVFAKLVTDNTEHVV
ncbi:uncharacterized protein EV422DRAFT_567592 [Fimicolochytrium jonesii]|uniref:uncharacterized protein n=1 Tax=Fimicolochytrium jonesii TaxID=1396493 RepID=UPI0022FE30D7|nr:uncharacterized protein EV422DRAFT_567592 [Fimicolochytrium jonesii]KAI8820697.1 hypothetical protein EV422DRAFT_567592 [Fimicolochytrium jonesii]